MWNIKIALKILGHYDSSDLHYCNNHFHRFVIQNIVPVRDLNKPCFQFQKQSHQPSGKSSQNVARAFCASESLSRFYRLK
jgi:hypothetical protein